MDAPIDAPTKAPSSLGLSLGLSLGGAPMDAPIDAPTKAPSSLGSSLGSWKEKGRKKKKRCKFSEYHSIMKQTIRIVRNEREKYN